MSTAQADWDDQHRISHDGVDMEELLDRLAGLLDMTRDQGFSSHGQAKALLLVLAERGLLSRAISEELGK